MKNYLPLVIGTLLVFIFTGGSCEAAAPVNGLAAGTEQAAPAGQDQRGKVVETMDSGGYTYVLVDTGSGQIWAVAPQFAVSTGDQVIVPEGMVMKDYTSKTLNKTFKELNFVGAVMVNGADTSSASGSQPAVPGASDIHGKSSVADRGIDLSGLEKAGQSVEEVYAQKDVLAGKEISVRGKVVKFSQKIMKTNWLHLQDGTGEAGTNDLVVTTDTIVTTGDTVLISGVLSANRDFGFGYRYDVIVESARVTVE